MAVHCHREEMHGQLEHNHCIQCSVHSCTGHIFLSYSWQLPELNSGWSEFTVTCMMKIHTV